MSPKIILERVTDPTPNNDSAKAGSGNEEEGGLDLEAEEDEEGVLVMDTMGKLKWK